MENGKMKIELKQNKTRVFLELYLTRGLFLKCKTFLNKKDIFKLLNYTWRHVIEFSH